MRLVGPEDSLELHVTGYQFPEATDARKRCSWHMVAGAATCNRGQWQFSFPALTCDESPRVAAWLRQVAEWVREVRALGVTAPGPLEFTEPNLTFAVAQRLEETATIEIGLDLEFRPPWSASKFAGAPFRLLVQPSSSNLIEGASSWDLEIADYPDCSQE